MATATQATHASQDPPLNTARVTKGPLAAVVALDGTLTYRARSDGTPYSVINQAVGRFTQLPAEGDTVECGDVLYRVDNQPVLLLCGSVPAYRDLWFGDVGKDVAQLNQNLHSLGYDARAGVDVNPEDAAFSDKTVRAFQLFQHDKFLRVTGVLAVGDAVFLPEPVRVSKVIGDLGGVAQSGAPVASVTSDTPEVQTNLEPSQQTEIQEGDAARITLPGNGLVSGTVDRLGRVAQIPVAQNNNKPGSATIPAFIRLDDPETTRGLDQAPVRVEVTTAGVESALSVPVTALVGKSGGGFAVEVVRADGRRELISVKVGLFDTAGGRVQVEGELAEGDPVVVPSP